MKPTIVRQLERAEIHAISTDLWKQYKRGDDLPEWAYVQVEHDGQTWTTPFRVEQSRRGIRLTPCQPDEAPSEAA